MTPVPTNPLDIARANRFGRVIYEGDPRADEFRIAKHEVHEIRMELARLRARLHALQPVESYFPHDSLALQAAGALTMVVHTMHSLEAGEKSFERRAERSEELWEDIRANPQSYVLKEGKSR